MQFAQLKRGGLFMKNKKTIITITLAGLGMAAFLYKNNMPKIPIKEYKLLCLELAEIDDQIARNELEGNTINRNSIVFPPKDKSIKNRYKIFFDMYKKYSREELKEEKKKLLDRLEISKQYKNDESEDLELVIE